MTMKLILWFPVPWWHQQTRLYGYHLLLCICRSFQCEN